MPTYLFFKKVPSTEITGQQCFHPETEDDRDMKNYLNLPSSSSLKLLMEPITTYINIDYIIYTGYDII